MLSLFLDRLSPLSPRKSLSLQCVKAFPPRPSLQSKVCVRVCAWLLLASHLSPSCVACVLRFKREEGNKKTCLYLGDGSLHSFFSLFAIPAPPPPFPPNLSDFAPPHFHNREKEWAGVGHRRERGGGGGERCCGFRASSSSSSSFQQRTDRRKGGTPLSIKGERRSGGWRRRRLLPNLQLT